MGASRGSLRLVPIITQEVYFIHFLFLQCVNILNNTTRYYINKDNYAYNIKHKTNLVYTIKMFNHK